MGGHEGGGSTLCCVRLEQAWEEGAACTYRQSCVGQPAAALRGLGASTTRNPGLGLPHGIPCWPWPTCMARAWYLGDQALSQHLPGAPGPLQAGATSGYWSSWARGASEAQEGDPRYMAPELLRALTGLRQTCSGEGWGLPGGWGMVSRGHQPSPELGRLGLRRGPCLRDGGPAFPVEGLGRLRLSKQKYQATLCDSWPHHTSLGGTILLQAPQEQGRWRDFPKSTVSRL